MKTTDLMMQLMLTIKPNETITRSQFLQLVNAIFPPGQGTNRIEIDGVDYIRVQACAEMALQVHEDHGVNIQYDTRKDNFVVSEDEDSALNLLEASTDALGSLLEAVRAKGIKVSNESDNYMKPGKWNLTMPGQQALKRERARHSALHHALGVLGYDLRSNEDKDGNWSWSITPPAGLFSLAFQNGVVVAPDEVQLMGHKYFSHASLERTIKAMYSVRGAVLLCDMFATAVGTNAPGEYNSWEKRVWTRGFDDCKVQYANLVQENEKLQSFKDYVHGRLDEAGVAKNPDGPHTKEGCRIGDRLDIVLAFAKQPPVPPLNVELQRKLDQVTAFRDRDRNDINALFTTLEQVGVQTTFTLDDPKWEVKLPIMFTPLDNGIRVNIRRNRMCNPQHIDVKQGDPGYDLIYWLYSDTLPRPAKA